MAEFECISEEMEQAPRWGVPCRSEDTQQVRSERQLRLQGIEGRGVPQAQDPLFRGLRTADRPEPTTSDILTSEDFEAEAKEAAGDYYRAAGMEDWAYAYEHLAPETQARFTREEGFKKNQRFADNGPVTYHVFSAELETATAQEIVVKISLSLIGEDEGKRLPRPF